MTNEELFEQCSTVMPTERVDIRKCPLAVGEVDGNQVVMVDGNKVLLDHDMDFTQGGNDLELKDRYGKSYIPEKTIWIDCGDLRPSNYRFVCFHEAHERRLIAGGMHYEKAHDATNAIEKELRQSHQEPERFSTEAHFQSDAPFNDSAIDMGGKEPPKGRTEEDAQLLSAALNGYASGVHMFVPAGRGVMKRVRVYNLTDPSGNVPIRFPSNEPVVVTDDREGKEHDVYFHFSNAPFNVKEATPVEDPFELMALIRQERELPVETGDPMESPPGDFLEQHGESFTNLDNQARLFSALNGLSDAQS
ncbi:hypothetical protein AYO40_01090 [Planctomycetaceae bacterium SCGC AG-212-D15]|nr:hypothetical protein AYO40_01090 [Planctomycetaceae bacterium SCGC AG-212-D15]